VITGYRCAVCGAEVPVATPWPWRCPNATAADRYHVMFRVRPPAPLRFGDDPNPLVAFDSLYAWAAFAEAHGMGADDRAKLVRSLDVAVTAIDGVGFVVTPFGHSRPLSEALGFSRDGGVLVKDDTANVAGSHKARHLAGIMLHLLAAEQLGVAPAAERPRLASASCGNAALAAATLAKAAAWPVEVFVPPWAAAPVVARLRELGAGVTVCPRVPDDPPGDPCVHRFREAVAAGAIPFAVQGPENTLCLDTGRSIGFEVIEAMGHFIDRVFVQVGGGALATCLALAAADEGIHPCLHTVQTQGCAPLERAWRQAQSLGVGAAPKRWDECMWPWEAEPRSAADGILDDETYDWVGAVQGMAASGGAPVVVTEAQVLEANELGRRLTGIDVSATGTAGLAGLLAIRDEVADDERVVVLFTGREQVPSAT
jgi:threonine synthase